MARRSARIASSSKTVTASPAPRLGSVVEQDEGSPAFGGQSAQRLDTLASSPMPHPATPAVATPVKLPMSEMHPSKVHPTTAAPSSGLKLGFVDIDYTKDQANGVTQSTPSKTPYQIKMPSTDFTFRYTRLGDDGDKGLSPAAKSMMDELRNHGDAEKIKAELRAQREQEKLEDGTSGDGRKIRQAKGRAGRFSAVHMAEFKKMDSIENHPSAFRAAPSRQTPVKNLKRTQSKANLDEPESIRSKKSSTRPVPTSSTKQQEETESPVKRVKQGLGDDVSSLRPVSRDGSFLPRPKSSGNDSMQSNIPRSQALANLMTPTKSSIARASSTKTPTVTLVKSSSKPDLSGLAKSPSKPELGLTRTSSKTSFSNLKKSMTTSNLSVNKIPGHVETPGRFDRVKSILKRQISGSKSKSSIPQLTASPSKTTLHESIDEELPSAPLTTPGRKVERRMNFTPMAKRATQLLNSPSPVKSSIPRSKTVSQLNLGITAINKPAGEEATKDEVAYPDLSAYCRDVSEEPEKPSKDQFPASVPGTFTFRSDHTIRFDSSSPKGFGGAAGQASLRHIRESILPTSRMPGSFPRPSDASPNKENNPPAPGSGIPHGMTNKKRHRASWDEEEEDEANKRTAKKLRKNPTVEGHALVAPRLMKLDSPAKKAGTAINGTPSPQKKKKGGLSMSRLNMLARPKVRK
ncbi:uncharacterized protein F4822DRAFT_19994 [Hypoxylon trugodes]|uniref:uncharacterized protein n=1 Tax=Hypoxylon trugodes TaxID=326681 RepID=UPI00219E0B37|nr:uncharacterized protein F4822DRAFT_19994 [Hypoxylon trugodes]KAI1393651.1 hypothetical protein F4822DRAFT_19994 [Hypoxylon trugodes]